MGITIDQTIQFNRFLEFAQRSMGTGNEKAVARTGDMVAGAGGALTVRSIKAATTDKAFALFRSGEDKADNNATRELFKKVIADLFGGESLIPESVRDAMLMKDYGAGKPLTARRIMAVKTAIDAYYAYGSVDFFAKQTNVDHARRLGYTAVELPKLNRALNLFMEGNPGVTQDQALLEVMTPGRPANRLMRYGGRFMEDAKSFAQGLKLIGDFAVWHEDLKEQVRSGNRTSLTAVNQRGAIIGTARGLETFVFEELASNRNINLYGKPEEVFGMKNNPATCFFGRELHSSNSFTFLQMPQEKRALFFRCSQLLLPLQDTHSGKGAIRSGVFTTVRLLRHFDELERLQAHGQLTQKKLLETCFGDIRPISTSNPDDSFNQYFNTLQPKLYDYIEKQTGKPLIDPTNRQGQSLFATLGSFIHDNGLTFEEACGYYERGEIPPKSNLQVPFSCDLQGIVDPEAGLKALDKDFHRPDGYSRTDDPQQVSLLRNPRFTVNLPGGQPMEFLPTAEKDPVHQTKMQQLYDQLETLCGKAHPRQLNALLFSMGQGALSQLRSGFPSLGISSSEHSAVTFTLKVV